MNKVINVLLTIVLVIACVVLIMIPIIAINNNRVEAIDTTNRQFKAIQVYDGFSHGTITVDMDTKIMYMTNIGPLYNKDGSFKIYEGE